MGGRPHRRQTGWASDYAVGWRSSGSLPRCRRFTFHVHRFYDVVISRRCSEPGVGIACAGHAARNQRGRIRSRSAVDVVGADAAVSRRGNRIPGQADDAGVSRGRRQTGRSRGNRGAGSCVKYLDAIDHGLIHGAVGERKHHIAAAVGWLRVLLNHSRVARTGRCVDVEVGEHRCAVDGHIELPIASRREIQLGKVQTNYVIGTCGQAGNRISHDSLPRVLVDCRGGSATGNAGGNSDCIRDRVGGSTRTVIFVSNEGIVAAARVAHRRTAGVDGYVTHGYRGLRGGSGLR